MVRVVPPDERELACHELQHVGFSLLTSRRYPACRRVSEIGSTLPGSACTHEAMRVNYWIAVKAEDGTEAA